MQQHVAIGSIRILLLSNPSYRNIHNDNAFAFTITTLFLSTQQSSLMPSSSSSSAKHKTTTNDHVCTTKKKSDGDFSSSRKNSDDQSGTYDCNINNDNNLSALAKSQKKSKKGLLLSCLSILVQMAFGNKRYFRIFFIATIAYGIAFSQISSVLVYRSQSFKYLYGINNIPSITTITYGPVGYAPALSIYVTDHMGLFIFLSQLNMSLAG